jgi:hypothetical protein
MEAIAYWMHCLVDREGEKLRTVVSLQDITDFLAQYIEGIEKPQRGRPQQMAEEFLRFVKDKAGLLIEVGEGQYSFVHLTFQEYLAATHLRKSGEVGGMGVVWQTIQDRCQEGSWHEVIRLLVGALERTAAQEFLLERIIPRKGEAGFLERALLAGGCLLDSVDAAEEMAEDILFSLLVAAAEANSLESLRRALRMINAWQEREEGNRTVLTPLARQAKEELDREESQVNLLLNLVSMGWSDEEIQAVSGRLFTGEDRFGQVFLVYLREAPPPGTTCPRWSFFSRNSLPNTLAYTVYGETFSRPPQQDWALPGLKTIWFLLLTD